MFLGWARGHRRGARGIDAGGGRIGWHDCCRLAVTQLPRALPLATTLTLRLDERKGISTSGH